MLALCGVLLLVSNIHAQNDTNNVQTFNFLSTNQAGYTVNGALVGRDPGLATPSSDPFLSVQQNGSEIGYNTDGGTVSGYHHKGSLNLNSSIQISDLIAGNVTNELGEVKSYYALLLDISENSSEVSMDRMQVYVGTNAALATTNIPPGSAAGTLVWDLDGGGTNRSLLLNDLGYSGGGKGGFVFLIPTSNFAGFASNSYVTVYTGFGFLGSNFVSQGGIEQMFIATPSQIRVIPEPGSAAALLLASFAMPRRRRARR
jgi:hypothetical protein